MVKLKAEQLKLLAQFISNLGLVFTAGIVTPLFSSSQKVNIIDTISGLGLALICLIAGLVIIGEA